jgi:hypothetical protein
MGKNDKRGWVFMKGMGKNGKRGWVLRNGKKLQPELQEGERLNSKGSIRILALAFGASGSRSRFV